MGRKETGMTDNVNSTKEKSSKAVSVGKLKQVENGALHEQRRWLRMIRNLEAYCYIKPNMYRHESGYRCFEVGYLVVGEDRKVKEKLVLSKYSDHIQLYQYSFEPRVEPNLDLLLDGYIRIYNIASKDNYWWGRLDFVCSSAQIELLKGEE